MPEDQLGHWARLRGVTVGRPGPEHTPAGRQWLHTSSECQSPQFWSPHQVAQRCAPSRGFKEESPCPTVRGLWASEHVPGCLSPSSPQGTPRPSSPPLRVLP